MTFSSSIRERQFLCLHCIFIGCRTHCDAHFETTKHHLFIDVASGHVRCSKCKDYVYDPEFERIAMIERCEPNNSMFSRFACVSTHVRVSVSLCLWRALTWSLDWWLVASAANTTCACVFDADPVGLMLRRAATWARFLGARGQSRSAPSSKSTSTTQELWAPHWQQVTYKSMYTNTCKCKSIKNVHTFICAYIYICMYLRMCTMCIACANLRS